MKNDGYCPKARIFFAAHATRGTTAAKIKKKINDDLVGCLHKHSNVKEFIFVTNDNKLIGEIEKYIDEELRQNYITPNSSLEKIDALGAIRLTEMITTKFSLEVISEILDLNLSFELRSKFSLNIPNYVKWIRELANKRITAINLKVKEEDITPKVLKLSKRVRNESDYSSEFTSLIESVRHNHQMVLVGEAGSGKTTSLWQLIMHYCEILASNSGRQNENKDPISFFIDLLSYKGETISELVISQVNASGQSLTKESLYRLANVGLILLVFDDFDLVGSQYRSDILRQIKEWCRTFPKCIVVVTSHQPSDGHTLGISTFRLQPLNTAQARAILRVIQDLDDEDINRIIHGLRSDTQHLIENPLTLLMAASVYLSSEQRLPSSRGDLYKEFVHGILASSEEKGEFEFAKSDKILLLSLLAKWMQNNEVYSISPSDLGQLIEKWGKEISYLGSFNHLKLRSELINSGLIHSNLEGNLEFVHHTYLAYLAATTITIDQLQDYLNQQSWHTSLLFWISLKDKMTGDKLIEMLSNRPILLGDMIRERADLRKYISEDQVDMREYFREYARFFKEFVKNYPVLMTEPPWNSLNSDNLQLLVSRSAQQGYLLLWKDYGYKDSEVKFIETPELLNLARKNKPSIPPPIFIIPDAVIRRYHPLEIVYLWTIRALHDLLIYFGWSGGLDLLKFSNLDETHIGVGLIVNRFLAYQNFAHELPEDIRSQLPFYAHKEYELYVEVHNDVEIPFVRYAVLPGTEAGKINIIQAILGSPQNDPVIFIPKEDGSFQLTAKSTERNIDNIEEQNWGSLMLETPGHQAQKWLLSDLKRYLPIFPPEAW